MKLTHALALNAKLPHKPYKLGERDSVHLHVPVAGACGRR